jgi:hypothetical protein
MAAPGGGERTERGDQTEEPAARHRRSVAVAVAPAGSTIVVTGLPVTGLPVAAVAVTGLPATATPAVTRLLVAAARRAMVVTHLGIAATRRVPGVT